METEETLRNNDEATNRILDAIGELKRDLSQEFNQKIGDLSQEFNQKLGDFRRQMNERFERIEMEIIEIKEFQFSCDVRLERVQSMSHEALKIGYDLKADMKIMNAELRAWAKDVLNLQERVI